MNSYSVRNIIVKYDSSKQIKYFRIILELIWVVLVTAAFWIITKQLYVMYPDVITTSGHWFSQKHILLFF